MPKEGKKRYDQLSLKIPIIGSFLKKIFLIRFAENISTLIGAGLSINNALKITRDTVGNYVYKTLMTDYEVISIDRADFDIECCDWNKLDDKIKIYYANVVKLS